MPSTMSSTHGHFDHGGDGGYSKNTEHANNDNNDDDDYDEDYNNDQYLATDSHPLSGGHHYVGSSTAAYRSAKPVCCTAASTISLSLRSSSVV